MSNGLYINMFSYSKPAWCLNHLNRAQTSPQPCNECISLVAPSTPLFSVTLPERPPPPCTLFCAANDLITPDYFQGDAHCSQPHSSALTSVIHLWKHLRMFSLKTHGTHFFLTHRSSLCAERPNKGSRSIKRFTTVELKG